MWSIILASPSPLHLHQHYLHTSPEVYLGPQSNELAQILYCLRIANRSDLGLLWYQLHIRAYVWPYSRQSDPNSRQDPNSGRQPSSSQLEEGILKPLPFPLPWPHFSQTQGTPHYRKWRGGAFSIEVREVALTSKFPSSNRWEHKSSQIRFHHACFCDSSSKRSLRYLKY